MSDLVFVAALATFVYLNSLNCQFVFDDFSAIVSNQDVISTDLSLSSIFQLFQHDFWGTPIGSELSHKSYRPLTVLTFKLNRLLNGTDPCCYHFVNLILHLIVSCLFYCWCNRIGFHSNTSWIAALLFASHPIHTEAVTGIVGRAELLSAIFFFAALFSYANRQFLLFVVQVICATLSKEQGITVLAVCLAIEVCECFKNKEQWTKSLWRMFFLANFGVVILAIRIHIMGGRDNIPVFTKFDNPSSFAPTFSRYLTYNHLFVLNAFLLIYPLNLCCDWTMQSVALIQTVFDFRNFFILLFYVILINLFYQSALHLFHGKNHNLIITLSMIVFPFLPASNLFFPVGFVIAERVLYIPSAGFCMLIALGWQNLVQSNRIIKKHLVILLSITIFAYALKTQSRNFDWNDELKLFSSGTKVNPNNAKLYNNIGHYYERQRNFAEAVKYFELGSKHQPDDLGSSINIARTLINIGKLDEAEKLLWQLKPRVKFSTINKRIVPSYLNLWINLGSVIGRNQSRLQEAEEVYREVISMRSDFIEAYINLGDILIRQSKILDAIEIYKQGLKLSRNSKSADFLYNLGVAYSILMQNSSDNVNQTKIINLIAEYFVNSTVINSFHKESLVNLAILIQKHQHLLHQFRTPLIEKMKKYAGVDQEFVYFNLALLLADQNDSEAAKDYLKKAIEIKKDFRSALFNLALILIEQKKFEEAEKFLNQLIHYHPNHTKSLMLLGDIYFSQFSDFIRAEKCYLRVLKYNQTHAEATHNLCVVYSRRNKIEEANRCFQKFSKFNSQNTETIDSIF